MAEGCLGVTVMPPCRPSHRARGGHGPLRPELAAPLGSWSLPKLTEGVGDSSCLLLSGVVAVLGCCIVTARTGQGMARARSGQPPAWPLVSDRSVRRGLRDQATSRARLPGTFTCARWPAVTVTLEAGRADTYTQRAIPGPQASKGLLHFHVRCDLDPPANRAAGFSALEVDW